MKKFMNTIARKNSRSRTESNPELARQVAPFPSHGLLKKQLGRCLDRDQLTMQFIDGFVASNDWRNKHLPKHEPGSGTLRIASYNLHRLDGYAPGTGGRRVIEAILEINADILCLQESPIVFPESVRRQYPYMYEKEVLFGHHRAGWGNVILSRYELTMVEAMDYDDGSKETRNFVSGCLQLADSSVLRIICTHLDVWDDSGRTRKREVEQLDAFARNPPFFSGSPSASRTQPAELKPENTIILGDLNAIYKPDYSPEHWHWIEAVQDKGRGVRETDSWTMADIIEERKWKDILRDHNGGQAPCVTTWAIRRVDYMLLHPEFSLPEPVGAYVHYSSASDHLPVFVDFPYTVMTPEGQMSV